MRLRSKRMLKCIADYMVTAIFGFLIVRRYRFNGDFETNLRRICETPIVIS